MIDIKNALDAILPPTERVSIAQRIRNDGWFSALSGIGTASKDKSASNQFLGSSLAPDEAEDMWLSDDLSARAIEAWPGEMLREGFRLKIQRTTSAAGIDVDGDNGSPARVDVLPPVDPGYDAREISATITNWWSDIKLFERLYQAMTLENGLGGALLVMGVKDYRKPDQPLNEDRIEEFDHINVFDCREATPIAWQDNPFKPDFGEPLMFRVTPFSQGNAVSAFDVHASRCIVFPGIRVSRRQTSNNGWGQSVLVRVMKVISDYNIGWGATAILLHDFAQAVIKIKGLAEAVALDDDNLIRDRMEMIELTRSVARAIILDAEEEFERKQTPITGLADILEKLETRVAAALDMPVTLLFGRSPGGLNATGDSDIRFFYDRVASKNKRTAAKIERVCKLGFKALGVAEPPKWSVEAKPLWQESAKEQADTRKVVAETDAIYIAQGVLYADEVARDRYGSDDYSPETSIDFDQREQLEEMEQVKEAEAQAAALDQMKAQGDIAGKSPAAPPFGGAK